MAAKKDAQDFSKVVDAQIPKLVEQGKKGDVSAAIDNLLALEKQCRQGEDESSTAKVAVAILRLLADRKDWKLLNSHIALLAKRRAQFSSVITKTIQEAILYLDDGRITDDETRLALIEVLRTVSAGKIFVELERARLTLRLAHMKETTDPKKAAEIIQEVTVETLGSMEKREKTDYIIEQMRLVLQVQDYIRTLIISRKIHPKVLLETEMQDLKLKFNRLMIEYYTHENLYLEVCRCYLAIFDTAVIQADPVQAQDTLKKAAVFVLLAPHDTEQQTLLHRIHGEKDLKKLKLYASMVKRFVTKELINWPRFETLFRDELLQHADVFGGEDGRKRYADLRVRVIEHNIRVIAAYYQRCTLVRLAELLTLDAVETEKHLSDMVVAKSIYAKIDRPVGQVVFVKEGAPNELLNSWSSDLSKLLSLVETCTHNIQKENMMYKVATTGPADMEED